MRMILNKGHRIRASDKNLVYRFSMGTLLFVFVAVILLLNTKQLMRTDWEHFSLLDNGFTLSLYNFITIPVSYTHLDVYKRQGFYNKDNLPAEATRTWVTKTIAETDGDGTTHYITKLGDAYKVSGDNFYMQNGKAVLPLGTLTVEETKAPSGYLLDGAYMQAGDKSEQIKGLYLTPVSYTHLDVYKRQVLGTE